MSENKEKFRVSFSSLETYKTCKRKYFYGYVLKLPKLDRPWFTFGNFNHLILEKLFKYILYFKKRNRAYNKKELLYRAFRSALKKWHRLHKQGKIQALTDKQISETKDILRKFLSRIENEEPDVYAIEKEFWIDLSDDIVLLGYIDRVDRAGEDAFRIVDYKTSKEAYKVDKNDQLDIYAIGFLSAEKLDPKIKIYKQLDFIKVNKQTDPDNLHNNLNNEKILSNLKKVSEEIKNKISLHPENKEAWVPTDNDFCWACDFKDQCRKDRGLMDEELFGS